MSLSTASLILAATFNFLIGFFVVSKGEKGKSKIFYGFFAASIVIWCLSLFFFTILSSPTSLQLWGKIPYLAALSMAFFLVFFAFYFPYKRIKRDKLFFALLLVPLLSLTYFLIFSNTIIGNFQRINNESLYQIGNQYISFAFFIVFYFAIAFIEFGIKYFKSSGIIRTQVGYIFLGTIISACLGLITNLVLPIMGIIKYNWIGPVSTFVMITFFAYAILKHHLLNIKVITTEIFSILVSSVLLVNALLSKSTNDFILNFSLFGAIAFFSILLIRSVLKEVKTREKLAELTKELQKANEDLKKLDKAKSEFISIASHQLRTPMSIIKGFVSMLLEGSYGRLQEKQKDVLNKIYASNSRLIDLINDLLDLSRMEGGRMQFRWEAVAFGDMVSSVVEELKPAADKKGLGFKWTNEIQGKIYVRADQEKLRQVIMNLVDNAIKYTPQGSVEVKLKKTPEGKARFSVKDTGIGINQEELATLFGKFVRGKKTQQLWTEGTGLGLYVARKIIEEHKGAIWAESEGENKGSTFFVELPAY